MYVPLSLLSSFVSGEAEVLDGRVKVLDTINLEVHDALGDQ